MNIALVLPRAQRRRLERQSRKTPDKFEAMRCRILLLLHAGHSVRGIVERVACARATVYRTVYRFEERGESGLSDRRLQPEARKVTPELMNYLLSIGRLVSRASDSEEAFYMDEADIDLNPRIGPCYMKRGRQLHHPQIEANPGMAPSIRQPHRASFPAALFAGAQRD